MSYRDLIGNRIEKYTRDDVMRIWAQVKANLLSQRECIGPNSLERSAGIMGGILEENTVIEAEIDQCLFAICDSGMRFEWKEALKKYYAWGDGSANPCPKIPKPWKDAFWARVDLVAQGRTEASRIAAGKFT